MTQVVFHGSHCRRRSFVKDDDLTPKGDAMRKASGTVQGENAETDLSSPRGLNQQTVIGE
jgi:hypothetical protein